MIPKPSSPSGVQFQPGAVVEGVYEIRGRLGIGGMAVVYEAWQQELQQTVALKVINSRVAGTEAVRQLFFNELLLATRIRHPNVVRVLDFGLLSSDGAPYIAMERLEGRGLRRFVRRRGPLAMERAVKLFLGALSALREAHERGIVHRDLKPTNLFLHYPDTAIERLVVLDFGIALRGRDGAVLRDQFVGTPQYAAPEYVRHGIIAPSVDVYQMGLSFAEALLGHPVVQTTDFVTCLRTHCQGLLEIPDELLDSPVGPVLQRALALDPDHRYPHAGAFHDALAAVASGRAARIASGDPADEDWSERRSRLPPVRSEVSIKLPEHRRSDIGDQGHAAADSTGDPGSRDGSGDETDPDPVVVEPSVFGSEDEALDEPRSRRPLPGAQSAGPGWWRIVRRVRAWRGIGAGALAVQRVRRSSRLKLMVVVGVGGLGFLLGSLLTHLVRG